MQHHIFKLDIDSGGNKGVTEFIFQETELRQKNLRVVKDTIYYFEPANDQYKSSRSGFLEEVFQWLDRLQEAPEFKDRVKRRLHWNAAQLVVLHRLDHPFVVRYIFGSRLRWTDTSSNLLRRTTSHFRKKKQCFTKGPRGRLLRDIPLWMKVLLAEEGMLHVLSEEMAV
jgi:hypothetical protein